MEENKQLTAEESAELTSLRDQSNALIIELGQLQMELFNLELSKDQLTEKMDAAKKKHADLARNETQLNFKMFEKYGKVNIDVDTGTILA